MVRLPKMVKRMTLIVAGIMMLLTVAVNCDSGDSSGSAMGCEGNIPPGGFPTQERVDNLVQVRVTNFAFEFISSNLTDMLTMFMGDEGLSFEMPANDFAVGTSVPRDPVTISMEVVNPRLIPTPTNRISVHIELRTPGHNGMSISLPSSVLWIPCTLHLDTNAPFPIDTDIVFNIQPDRTLTFDIADPQFDINAVSISGCVLGDMLNPFKSLFEGLIRDAVVGFIDDALNSALCYNCKDDNLCPSGTYCQDELCMETGNRCKAKPLGIEIAIDLGELLADALPGAHSAELYAALHAGGYAEVDQSQGLNLGMFGGTKAPNPAHDCVDVVNYPRSPAPRMNYTNYNPHFQPGVGTAYDAAIGLSEMLLDQAGTNIYNAGTLCLTLDSSIPDIGTYLALSNFSLVLSSINEYTQGRDVPSMLTLQPQKPIDFAIGAGINEVDPETGALVMRQPLLTVRVPRLWLNVYGMVEERMVRLFTVETDIVVALGLEISDDFSTIELVWGENPIALENMNVPFSILAESDADIVELLEGLIGTVMGQFDLASMVPPIELPPLDLTNDGVADIELQVQNITGDLPKSNPADEFQILSIYAALSLPSPAPPESRRLDTMAWKAGMTLPSADNWMRSGLSKKERMPSVTMLMDAVVPVGYENETVEYSYRIDKGFWSPWNPNRRLILRDQRLAIPGTHSIAVRSRLKGVAGSTDLEPAVFDVDIQVENELFKALKLDTLNLGGSMNNEPAAPAPSTFNNAPAPAAAAANVENGGCAAGTGWIALLLLAFAGLLRRGRKAATMLVIAGMALLPLMALQGCGSESSSTGNCDVACTSSADCGEGQQCVNGCCEGISVDGDEDVIEVEEEGPVTTNCTSHEDCIVKDEPEDKYYCSGVSKTCKENPCFGDNPDDVCHEAKESGCAYCDVSSPIHECKLDRCTSNDDCDCFECTGDNELSKCDVGTGLCICKPPCGGSCGEKVCCENELADNYDRCLECPAWCPDLECDPGYQPLEDRPEPWNTEDTCSLMDPDTCSWPDQDCDPAIACEAKPDVALGRIGRYMSFVVEGNSVVHIAAFNEGDDDGNPYGDLMYGAMPFGSVMSYPTNDENAAVEWEFVDGVPLDEEPSGNPEGVRNGIDDPGEDVGRYTSIAIDADNLPMISYYDQTNGNLKFAQKVAGEEDDTFVWNVYTIDDAANTGLYTSMILSDDGIPMITYMQASDVEIGAGTSAVRLAIAANAHPAGPEDWTLTTVEAVSNPKTMCFDACGEGQACAIVGGKCRPADDGSCLESCPSGMSCLFGLCHDILTGDDAVAVCGDDEGNIECTAGQVCIAEDAQGCVTVGDACGGCDDDEVCTASGQCAKAPQAPVLVDLPQGIGLWPKLVKFPTVEGTAMSGKIAITYYHRSGYDNNWHNTEDGNLKIAYIDGPLLADTPPTAGDWTVEILAGETAGGNDTGDMGRFPSVSVMPNGWFLIAFYDNTMHRLMYYRYYENTSSEMVAEVVVADDGIRRDRTGREYVAMNGADTSVIVDEVGTVSVLYQDQTTVELRYRSEMITGESVNENRIILGGAHGGNYANDCAPNSIDTNYECTGAYGFYNSQALVNGIPILGTFYYDLKKEPMAMGLWFLMP